MFALSSESARASIFASLLVAIVTTKTYFPSDFHFRQVDTRISPQLASYEHLCPNSELIQDINMTTLIRKDRLTLNRSWLLHQIVTSDRSQKPFPPSLSPDDRGSVSRMNLPCDARLLRNYKHVVSTAEKLVIHAFLAKSAKIRCQGAKHDKSWFVRFTLDNKWPSVVLTKQSTAEGGAYAGGSSSSSFSASDDDRVGATSLPSVTADDFGPFARRRDVRGAVARTRALFLLRGTTWRRAGAAAPCDAVSVTAAAIPPASESGLAASDTLSESDKEAGLDAWRPGRPCWGHAAERQAAAALARDVWSGVWDAAAVLRRQRGADAAVAADAAALAAAEEQRRGPQAGAAGPRSEGKAAGAGGSGAVDLLAGLSDGVLRATARIDGLRELQVASRARRGTGTEGRSSQVV
jgi:hypothetical protein